MKKLELENFGVQELSAKEMEDVNGGFWGFLVGFAVAAVALWGVANFVKDVIIEGEDFNMKEW